MLKRGGYDAVSPCSEKASKDGGNLAKDALVPLCQKENNVTGRSCAESERISQVYHCEIVGV